jgi:hypothetical protein
MTHFPKLLLLLFAVTVFTVGSSDTKAAEEVKTVEWWQLPENKVAMTAKVEECLKRPNPKDDQNCINAATAAALGGWVAPVRQPPYKGFYVKPPSPTSK